MDEPDVAIDYCTESLAINDGNWRAYSNRAYAYYLKRRFDDADRDLDRALLINPDARQMPEIRGMMNERRLRGRVTIEERQQTESTATKVSRACHFEAGRPGHDEKRIKVHQTFESVTIAASDATGTYRVTWHRTDGPHEDFDVTLGADESVEEAVAAT